MTDLDQRNLLITGANGGVGVALVENLLESGVRKLALQYRRSAESLLPVLKKFDLDPEKVCFQADMTKETDAAALREKVLQSYGPVWGLINLAGSTSNGMSWKLTLDQFNQIIAGNLTATFLACREFIPSMREVGGGRILNTSSVVAFTGVAGASHYCAAKAGIAGFTKGIALELASKGITANALALGYFNYGMLNTVPEAHRNTIQAKIPVGRFGKASEIGGLIRFLLSDEGAYTTGQVLHVNGGLYN